jgi:ABC-type transport system involved in multi-copper enzyme maturation permease subunit
MLHLLKLEWLKVKNYRAFWIFLGLYVIALFSINYIAYQLQVEIKKNNVPLEVFPYGFPKSYQTIAWVSSWLLYFPGMLMILVISNEYTFKTHRQNIIDGLTRKEFVTSKILFGLVLALITTIACAIIALGFGYATTQEISFEGFENIGYCFLQSLCYIFLAMILAVLFRRSGLAMAICFLYGLVFEQLIGMFFDNRIFDNQIFWYYMPLQASDVLIPITFGKELFYKDAPSSFTLVVVCCIYIVAYCFFAIRKFETDDL